MGVIQKIKSVLVPEIGVDLTPEFVTEMKVDSDFSRTLAHVVGRTGQRSIIIKATSDGRLMVAAAGTAAEVYVVETGEAPDEPDEWDEYDQENAIYVTDVLAEANNMVIQFRNLAGVYGNSIIVNVGFRSFDFIHYGIRIQNRVGGAAGVYEITMYR